MNALDLHDWRVTPGEGVAVQRRLRERLVCDDDLGPVRLVAGADIALDRREKKGFGAVVVYAFPELIEVERQTCVCPRRFPYVPGLLAFREAPVLLEAFAKVRCEPDLLVFDAHGYAHPRRLGLASHLGLVFDRPSIGCAKSVLVGTFEPPAPRAGSWTPLRDGDEVVGAAVRTRDRVKPVFVSVGHRVSLQTAIRLILACRDRTRIPKPTREADRLCAALKRGERI